MAQVRDMEQPQNLLSPPMSEHDQDTETASFMNHLRGAQADHNMVSATSQDSADAYNMYKAPYTHNMHQEVPQGSNGHYNTADITMESDMNSRIQGVFPTASVLPQTRTLYSAGASEVSPSNAHGNAPNRQGLRLSTSNPLNAVTSAVNVFAQVTPHSATSPPFSSSSNKHTHGIASALGSSISSGLGITIPNYLGSNSSSAAQPGLFKGLGLVSGIGAAAAGAGYDDDSAKVNDSQGDQGTQSSFNELRSSAMNQRDEDDDTYNTAYPLFTHSPSFPHSPSRSPYLSAHSRPLSPTSEAHSPSAYPPSSPYPSPGPSPLALSPGGLSPGPSSPGPEGSDAEGVDISPDQSRGRLRGRRKVQTISTTRPVGSAGPWSAGQIQQSPFVQGVAGSANLSRRADTVGGRHSRSRGKSVSEVIPGNGSRGASPYPQMDSRGSLLSRKLSASALSYGASQHHNLMTGTIPSHDIPPLELHNGSAASSRDHSVAPYDPGTYIQPYPHSYPGQQQQFQHPHSDQYLNPPISPHSPHFGANVPGVGSPTIGLLHSPHSLSPHSLSPHSGPPFTPSPELGGPNVAGGYGGSVHSSPGLGLDHIGGMSGSGELQFAMDAGENAMQLGNIGPPDNGVQYAQATYPNDVQLTGMTNDFGMIQTNGSSGFPGSAALDPSWAQQQAQMSNIGMSSWPQDQNDTAFQLTTERVQAAYGTYLGPVDGNGAYSQNPAASVQANMGDQLGDLINDPLFWQEPFNDQSLNPEQGDRNGALGAGNSIQWGGSANPGQDSLNNTQTLQQPIYSQQAPETLPYSHLIGPRTVPPSPGKEIMLPWNEQPASQLPPGGMQSWQAQMQLPNMIQDGMQPMPYNVAPHPNENPAALSVPTRPIPMRRRSKSDTTYFVQHQPQPTPSTSGYFTGQVHNSPGKRSDTLDPKYAMKFGGKQEEDNIIRAEGPGLKLSRTLPSAKGHRQTVSAVPSFAFEDWSDRAHGQPHQSRLVASQSYQGPSAVAHGAAPLNDNYGVSQPGPSLYTMPGYPSNPQHPPLNHTMTYPPPNPVPDLPLAGPSTLARNNSNSKQKQQGQRNEVDERKLADAFMPGSFRNDPVLRYFLDLIRRCSFYLEDRHEPLLGTPEAEQLFAQVRARYPHDLRFTSRNDPRFSSQPLDNETRDSQSIFMLLTENNQCFICGAQKDRTGRALGHVRSDIGHRPYHCNCDKCMQSANPRRFFSDNLLDDHLKGQQVKQKCVYCNNLFRRGGMKRHLTSKHPEHIQGGQETQENDDHED